VRIFTNGLKFAAITVLALATPEKTAAEKFLNGGNPEAPIKVGGVSTRITGEFVEIVVPKPITEGSPEMLTFECCNWERVR